jgi:L-ribulose-5-phosphate 3-epimerase UlaE
MGLSHMKGFKIVDVHKDGTYKTLYHGVNRSKTLKTNEWLKAEIKNITDGSSQQKYKSGFHILPTYEGCVDYLKKFKKLKNKKIVKCRAKNVWPKTHSKSDVYLAEYILIEG